MKAFQHTDFRPGYPETFNWGLLDSQKLQAVARRLVLSIQEDLTTADRLLTPGLRHALRELAAVADI